MVFFCGYNLRNDIVRNFNSGDWLAGGKKIMTHIFKKRRHNGSLRSKVKYPKSTNLKNSTILWTKISTFFRIFQQYFRRLAGNTARNSSTNVANHWCRFWTRTKMGWERFKTRISRIFQNFFFSSFWVLQMHRISSRHGNIYIFFCNIPGYGKSL